MKRPLWVQGGKQIGECRSVSGSTIIPGKRENIDLARVLALGWREMGAVERCLEGKNPTNLCLLIDWKKVCGRRKVKNDS